MIAGSVADDQGPRRVFLPGYLLMGMFMSVCGVSRDGVDLITFRAIATATALPSAVSIVNKNGEDGRAKDLGFASIRLGLCGGVGSGRGICKLCWVEGWVSCQWVDWDRRLCGWAVGAAERRGTRFNGKSYEEAVEGDWLGWCGYCEWEFCYDLLCSCVIHRLPEDEVCCSDAYGMPGCSRQTGQTSNPPLALSWLLSFNLILVPALVFWNFGGSEEG